VILVSKSQKMMSLNSETIEGVSRSLTVNFIFLFSLYFSFLFSFFFYFILFSIFRTPWVRVYQSHCHKLRAKSQD